MDHNKRHSDNREARQIYWKNRYAKLKARGRCVVCGIAFKATGVRCEDCKIKATAHTSRWQKKRRGELLRELVRLRNEVAELRRLLRLQQEKQ
jgi:hypothetical protein